MKFKRSKFIRSCTRSNGSVGNQIKPPTFTKQICYESYSPFITHVDNHGSMIDVLKSFTYFHDHSHPEIIPRLFVTTSMINEFGSIGILSYLMNIYPHRIIPWTYEILQNIPKITEMELKTNPDKRILDILNEKYDNNPLPGLIERKKSLLALSLISLGEDYQQSTNKILQLSDMQEITSCQQMVIFLLS